MTVLRAPAWARGPAANRQAAEPAHAFLPLGPNLACLRPVDLNRLVLGISI
jgi:hypothetical protein